jgi:hypothetical protein
MKKPNGITQSIKQTLTKKHGEQKYTIQWHESAYFTFRTGVNGWYGICTIVAKQFKPTVFKVVWDDSGYWKMTHFNHYNED